MTMSVDKSEEINLDGISHLNSLISEEAFEELEKLKNKEEEEEQGKLSRRNKENKGLSAGKSKK